MFEQIHRRLTIFFTIAAGTILACVMGLLLVAQINEYKKNEAERIKNSWLMINSNLQSGSLFDNNWLAQTEAASQLMIHIEENGIPLLFKGSWIPETNRDILLQRVKDAAGKAGLNMTSAPAYVSSGRTLELEITGDGHDRYKALVTILPTAKGIRSIALISHIQQQFPLSRLYFFILLYLCGIIGLWLVCQHFIGRALMPARDAEEKQKRFIAAASHELRSPLAVIRSTLFLLANNTPEQQQHIEHIDAECGRMSRLIGDMLLLYTADSKTWSMKPEALEMDSVAIDIYDSFLPLCRQKGVHLKLELPDEAMKPITGDRQRLEQVFAILLDNALSYSTSGTDILIKITFESGFLTTRIADHGCGIPDEKKPFVFDRFYCTDYSHSDKEHFGLGLSIAKEIIEMHQGIIQVYDNVPQGTCFKIMLPVPENY